MPDRLMTLRRQASYENQTVILVGDQKDIESLHDMQELNQTSTEEYLAEAERVNVDEWLQRRVEIDPESYHIDPGEWPATRMPSSKLMAHLDVVTNKPKRHVYCATLPTPHSWEAPAYLKFGNWNECPDAHYHVAMAKRWCGQYDAVLVAMTFDTLEFAVGRPPSSPDLAMNLAREQFFYCSDIVHQGLETIERLAASLLNGRFWYFWWD